MRAAYGAGCGLKLKFSVLQRGGSGVSLGPEGPFWGCFEVWAAQEWGVTPMERFGSGNELAGGCGRLRSGLWVGVAPEIGIFSSTT